MLQPVRALLHAAVGRHDGVGVVVEIGWRPQVSQLNAVGVVAALEVLGARVGEGQVASELQVVGDAMRSFEPYRRTGEIVVRPDDHALIVGIGPR